MRLQIMRMRACDSEQEERAQREPHLWKIGTTRARDQLVERPRAAAHAESVAGNETFVAQQGLVLRGGFPWTTHF
jgi:hypothetical protein